MKKETSAGAVVFRRNKEILYLILNYEEGHWDFPKGHIEKGETEIETLKREIYEETGIKDITLIKGFKERINYLYAFKKNLIDKKVIYYLAETKKKDIKLSFEHVGFKWLNLEDSIKQLSFKNAKQLLAKVDGFLKVRESFTQNEKR